MLGVISYLAYFVEHRFIVMQFLYKSMFRPTRQPPKLIQIIK